MSGCLGVGDDAAVLRFCHANHHGSIDFEGFHSLCSDHCSEVLANLKKEALWNHAIVATGLIVR